MDGKQWLTGLLLLVLFAGCLSKGPEGRRCKKVDQELLLDSMRARLKLPEFEVRDSMLNGEGIALQYSIQSPDTIFQALIFVQVPAEDSEALIRKTDYASLEKIRSDYRSGTESGTGTYANRRYQLLLDTTIQRNGTEVGYVKYRSSGEGPEAIESIIFALKENKVLDIRVYERIDSSRPPKIALGDCILESLAFL